ncbi:hypothetical protein VQ02_04010 [Methylobacterium variabile]|uniref:Uncharacterized protein n=1 Tax=Methylobacterium variabile TaxID=298794 RepID=A0A0J6T979_9HYPH|nr:MULTISPECIES: hypothetical protein [Methylobacterium]KMO42088.1 hypothetical protein VQ02_04010 [Methylobacterium variabile]NGM37267.1 hypothetical protein [Methylobacterium sp. DB0501]UHC20378.1 hypothetical protein LRS73_34620 [Methylobacterium currus]
MDVSIITKHFIALDPIPGPAAILQAGMHLAELLAEGRAIEATALRQAMTAACGGSDADGLWL